MPSPQTAIHCVECGTKLTRSARFCPECGQPQTVPVRTKPSRATRAIQDDTVAFAESGQGTGGTTGGPFLVVGWILAVLSLFLFPPFLGTAALITGIVLASRGVWNGVYLAVASIVLGGLGMLIGVLVAS